MLGINKKMSNFDVQITFKTTYETLTLAVWCTICHITKHTLGTESCHHYRDKHTGHTSFRIGG